MSLASLPDDLSPAAEAYIWGFPLVSIHRTRLLYCTRIDTGMMNHREALSTPKDKGIVVPNNDTLYSSGWYDLRHGDLQIDIPPMDHPKRYWNAMVVDAYTNISYICRRDHGVGGTSVRVTFDPNTPPKNDGGPVVTVSTPTTWVILRVLVQSPEDLETVRALQRSIKVTAPASHPHERTTRAGRAPDIGKAGAEFYSELKRYVELDPPAPWHPKLSPEAQAILDDPSGVPDSVLAAGVEEGEKLIIGRNFSDVVDRNGWRTGRDATDFGGDILKRAAGAKFGLGGHQAVENRSYVAQTDSKKQRLDGTRPLTMCFEADDMPPCNAFWSLTAYGPDMYLVENEIDRWSLSDRTPGLIYDEDGSLTICLSHERPEEIANWLPVPDGPYLLGLRVYEGHKQVIDCDWFPPPLVHQTS